MDIKTLLLLLLCCYKGYFTVIRSRNSEVNSTDDNVLTECTTPEAKTGYCVEIYKCLSLLSLHNMSVINTFKCGPSNENRKHPKVCCETDFLQLTTNPPPQPKNPLPASCGVQNVSTSSRILGGESSLPGEFPWMVRLLRKNSMDTITFSCTGALISARVVLTTAHCLVAPNLEYLGSLYVITLGEHETECGFGNNKCLQHKQTAMVSETIAHPDYNNTDKSHDNDIGLIILKQDVELSDFIAPICLLEEGYETSEYVISGWGKTESRSTSIVKLKTVLPPFSWQQCSDKYGTIKIRVTMRQICAGGVKGQDSCQGDSGGPLMVQKHGKQWFVAGLVSYGRGCGREGWPGVYTNVPNYVDWIKTTIAQKI